jgi:phospholipase A1
MGQDILVFVPGLLGTELSDAQGKIWPGSLLSGVLGFSDDQFNRLMAQDLKVGGIIEKAAGIIDIYGRWLDAFRSLARGGKLLFADRPATGKPTLYTAPYDWRLAIERSAEERLLPVLKRVHSDWGGQAQIHIVAHSLGGLVTRYLLQSGKFGGEVALGAIKSFITFGTPHNGAPVAVAGALGLHQTNYLSIEQSMRLANDPRYPSLYQTFPLLNLPLFWNRRDLAAQSLADRPFSVGKLKLNAANLQRAEEFQAAVSKNKIPAGIRQFLFVGTQFETITHFIWNGTALDAAKTEDAGDGTVSLQGAYVPQAQIQFTSQSHVKLILSEAARISFQRLFDADGLLGIEIELALRDASIAAGSETQARINSTEGFDVLHGELVWVRADIPPGSVTASENVPFLDSNEPVAVVRYDGPKSPSISLKLMAPSRHGVYRLVLRRDGIDDVQSSTIVVQK